MRMDMPNLQTIHHFDVIIVGSGGAGLSLALSLPNHFNIAVLAKAASVSYTHLRAHET